MAERFLTFRVDGELYALPANQVAEVIRLPAVARVPQAPKGLLGLANLRGSVLPVASVRGLLGAEESAEATTRAIVLDGAAPVALAVDAVEALVAVETDQIETRQAELATRPGERLKGAFAADGKNAIAKILDIEGLIGAAFVQEARARPRRAPAVALSGAAVPERETAGEAGGDDRQMLVSFDVAGQEYALALDVVQEILDTPEALAALPASEALVLGVTPFRDTLLPLLSLRGLLGFTGRAERTDREKIVVTRVGGALVGLLADRMRSIFPADADLIEKIPPVLSARAGGEAKISAIYRGENGRRLVSILAPEQLFREDVMQRLKASGGSTGEGDREAPAQPARGAPVPGVPAGRRRVRPADRGRRRGGPRPRPDHAPAEDAEVPRRRRQPARRGAAGGRPAAPLRHAGAGRARRSAAWSSSGPSATRRDSSSIRCPRCCAARPTRSSRRPT